MGRIDKWEQEMTKFEKDKEQWEEWQEEIAFKKSQVERGLTNYEALLEWQRDPKNKTELWKKKDEFFKSIKDMFMGSGNKNEKTYEGTILDNFNPEDTVTILDSLLGEFGIEEFNPSADEEYRFTPRYNPEQKDALRHYIGMQVFADKFGPTIASILGDLNEYPFDPDDVQEVVDRKNNEKALTDYKEGNMFDPDWLRLANYSKEENSATTLDSLLKHLIIPPPGGDYGE